MSTGDSFVPKDALEPKLNPSPHDRINLARTKLQKAIDFLPGMRPGEYLNTEDQQQRYQNNGCKPEIFNYRPGYGKTHYKWWSEVLLAVQTEPKDGDVENKEFGLFVDFHGGGFTTGDIRHGGWRQKHKVQFISENNIVCVCPNYPLMPWFTGLEITDAIRMFWHYIFSEDFQNHVQALHAGLKVRLENIVVSGDSAGAWLAMYSFLYGSMFDLAKPLNISVVYLQYPMFRHYNRSKPDDGWAFYETKFTEDDIKEHGEKLRAAWLEWRHALADEKINEIPFNVDIKRPWAPLGMGASFLGSTHDNLWKEMFQNNDTKVKDIVERLEDIQKLPTGAEQTKYKKPANIPDFYIYHGNADKNCLIEDTQMAVDKIKQIFKVGDQEPHVHFKKLKNIVHGFDHNYDASTDFIKDIHEKIQAKLAVKKDGS
ncbi:hypothetical protein K458DRAFT_454516 [Lentithecium fluviatile CBS 122367]|uniref:Alpha/beta hydrolase fold-3 domain-containing protein n=1 Tax=Lentithecium fluviatile CBS 122367 TaxID=1168545 RepID=A0A6G1IX38_9PLEO|nr:hypothetical protein K458DRAFT_454516 [Lentithecium fluviatile CBS 122367]